MKSPPHQRREIVEYFIGQSPEGTTVHHAEKVASERVYGMKHDVWDVDSSDGRWWVITNPTNLYPQETVPTPSMDAAFALHIGVVARMLAHQYYEAPVDDAPRDYVAKAWRRYEQAGEALNEAVEAEDFQAVGMRLRESLISFVQERAGGATVPEGADPPRRSDFKGWNELLAETASPGRPSGAEVRNYLSTMARETWDLVSWLTHAANATRADAETAFKATENVLATFALSLLRVAQGEPSAARPAARTRWSSSTSGTRKAPCWTRPSSSASPAVRRLRASLADARAPDDRLLGDRVDARLDPARLGGLVDQRDARATPRVTVAKVRVGVRRPQRVGLRGPAESNAEVVDRVPGAPGHDAGLGHLAPPCGY